MSSRSWNPCILRMMAALESEAIATEDPKRLPIIGDLLDHLNHEIKPVAKSTDP